MSKVEQRSNQSKDPLKITDLNDHCLQKIFGYLNVDSLFNVAVCNAYLRPAAAVAYERKFGALQVRIYKNPCLSQTISRTIYCDNLIMLNGSEMCFPYLRCLGVSIRNLYVDYNHWNQAQCDHIHQYVKEYCVSSLIYFELQNKQRGISIKH